jgi:hypothetical protein
MTFTYSLDTKAFGTAHARLPPDVPSFMSFMPFMVKSFGTMKGMKDMKRKTGFLPVFQLLSVFPRLVVSIDSSGF